MKILKRKINLSGFRQALMIFCFPAFISTACAVTYVRDDIPNITQSQSQLKTPKTFQVTQNCDGKYCLSGIDKTQEQSKSALKIEMSHEQCREDMGVTGFLSILTIGIVPGVLNYDCQISVRLQSSFEKRIETYKYQRTQNTIIGWLMLPGFLITPLFDRLQYNLWDDVNHSNEFRDFVKSDLGSKLSKSKYYQNTIKSHISYLKVEKDRERAEYKKLISRPRTVKQYLEFYDKSNHKEVYDKAWDKIHKRLDAHLVQLVRQKYRLNANDPVYEDGKEVGSLRHLFRLILLSNSDGLIDIEVKPVR